MRSRQPRSVMKNSTHLLKLSGINYFGGASLEACSANNLTTSDFNQTNKSWSFPLRGRGLGRGVNPSSFSTQSLTQDQVYPSPENLSFASRGVAQLDFLPSPTRGEGNVTQTNLGHSLALQERARVRCLPVRANIPKTNLTPSLVVTSGDSVLLTPPRRFSC